MSVFHETVAIFNGTVLVRKPIVGETSPAFSRQESPSGSKYNSLMEDDEPFDTTHFVARWWAVETDSAPSAR